MEALRIIKFCNLIILIFTMCLMLSVHYYELNFFKIFYEGGFAIFSIIAGFSAIAYGIYTMFFSFTKGG